MWAVDSKRYSIPAQVKTQDSDNIQWQLVATDRCEDNSFRAREKVLRKDPFVYTAVNTENGERMSFMYDGTSVKPAMRTLRKYGAKALQPVVAFLANVVAEEDGSCYANWTAANIIFGRLAKE